jgi:DNA adenine methylase
LTHSSFEETIPLAKEGDVVYCDRPYVPTSATSFVGYTADGFDSEDHRRLRDLAVELERKGVYVLISNSAAPAVIDL